MEGEPPARPHGTGAASPPAWRASPTPGFEFVDYDGRGDGVYYYAVARDPLALGDEHKLFELSAYRYGHPGYSWAAWLLTGGEGKFIPYAFLLLNLAGMGVAAGAASLISRELGHSAWGGLFVALNPGLVYATTIDTNEPVSTALLALVLLAWLRGRWILALPHPRRVVLHEGVVRLVLLALAAGSPWLASERSSSPRTELLRRPRLSSLSAPGTSTSSFTSMGGRLHPPVTFCNSR